jgi:mono/diheme cytochrome c family protein
MFLVLASVSDRAHASDEGPPAESDAARLYRRYCQRCHGGDGTGQRSADGIPDFTRRDWQKQRDDAELLVSILDGKGTGMPAFQDRLSEAQASGLVAHIRAFTPTPSTTMAKGSSSPRVSGSDFAAQFRQLQEEFDDLQQQLRELDSTRQRRSTSLPRDDRRARSGESDPQNTRSGMTPSTHNRASSTVGEQRRTSDDDHQATRELEGLAARIHPLLTAKCGQCHGAHLSRPKGNFGYILDLQRVCSNPKLVVPFRPEESKLWVLIRDNEMPPEKSSTGHLTAEEKGLVRDWIASGTPTVRTYSPAADSDPPSCAELSYPPPADASPLAHRLLRWLGRFHIPAIHFPIALFLAAAVGELWCMLWRWRDPWPPIRFCVLLGAAGSVLAAALGWLHADFGGHGAASPTLLGLHRWLGILGSCSAVAAAVASEIDSRRCRRCLLFRLTLFAAALLIGAAGHFGGNMIHGDDFFAW